MRRSAGHTGSAMGLIVSTVLLVLAPSATGQLTNGINTAPYANTHQDFSEFLATTGCGSASVGNASFNASTGVGHSSVSAKAKECLRLFTRFAHYSQGHAFSTAAVAFKTVLTSSSKYTIVANVSESFSAVESTIARGPCPYAVLSGNGSTSSSCIVLAFVDWTMISWLYDLTNGSAYQGSGQFGGMASEVSSYSYCSQGKCYSSNMSYGGNGSRFNGTISTNLTIAPPNTLPAGHRYQVVLLL